MAFCHGESEQQRVGPWGFDGTTLSRVRRSRIRAVRRPVFRESFKLPRKNLEIRDNDPNKRTTQWHRRRGADGRVPAVFRPRPAFPASARPFAVAFSAGGRSVSVSAFLVLG